MSVDNRSDGRLTARAKAPSTVLPASAAHEINNPLDSLLNLLYLIEAEAKLTEKGRHYLALAKEEVRRISQIAHETLDKNRVVVMREAKNVGELLASVLEFYKLKIRFIGNFRSDPLLMQGQYTGLHRAFAPSILQHPPQCSGGNARRWENSGQSVCRT